MRPEWSRMPRVMATRLGFRARTVCFPADFSWNWSTACGPEADILPIELGSLNRSFTESELFRLPTPKASATIPHIVGGTGDGRRR
jgi:hypothetical protein